MSWVLRVVLILASLGTTFLMIKRIRQSKLQIEDSIFWIVFSLLLIILSVFPGLADLLANALGIYSTVNFVFLFFIFILLIKQFLLTIKLSQMETKMRGLAQKLAIEENIRERQVGQKEEPESKE